MPKIEHTKYELENGDVVFKVNRHFFEMSQETVNRVGEDELEMMYEFNGDLDEVSSVENPFRAWFAAAVDTGEEFFVIG